MDNFIYKKMEFPLGPFIAGVLRLNWKGVCYQCYPYDKLEKLRGWHYCVRGNKCY